MLFPERMRGLGGTLTSSRAIRHPAARPGQLVEERGQVGQGAQREPAGDAVDRGVGHGQAEDVGLHARRTGPIGGEHAEAEVHRDRAHTAAGEIDAEVTGAAGEVEHALPAGRARSRTARLRQRTSRRNEMIRFSRSYFGAMASNMCRTAATFSSPSRNSSVSHSLAFEQARPGTAPGGQYRSEEPPGSGARDRPRVVTWSRLRRRGGDLLGPPVVGLAARRADTSST